MLKSQTSTHNGNVDNGVLRLKALREERKREALERSRLRQADPNYFAARAAAPPPPNPQIAEDERSTGEAANEEEEPERTIQQQDDDPFRSTSSKFKVFVR